MKLTWKLFRRKRKHVDAFTQTVQFHQHQCVQTSVVDSKLDLDPISSSESEEEIELHPFAMDTLIRSPNRSSLTIVAESPKKERSPKKPKMRLEPTDYSIQSPKVPSPRGSLFNKIAEAQKQNDLKRSTSVRQSQLKYKNSLKRTQSLKSKPVQSDYLSKDKQEFIRSWAMSTIVE